MTALPQTTLFRLLTIDDYLALGEFEHGYTELLEGRLLLTPGLAPRHSRAIYRFMAELERQLPGDLEAVPQADIDLELAPPDEPGFSRRPDLVVVDRSVLPRIEAAGGMIRASEVRVVIEFLVPGAQRTVTVTKRLEYADAGIPHYWIVDLSRATGTFTTTVPFPVTIDLGRLN